ncbi:MAG TPA: precorrin-2 C(20)-methyltransferase [Aliiroseovarius sp.]|nr:precorrin-2 C(20)-methyltransferase [Aliiroseovarius sp.]
MSGVLYGIGLGPGDPELMTLKAARLIGAATVLAYPALPGVDSFARSIAAGIIPTRAREITLSVPMSVERGPAQAAYDAGAAEIAAVLDSGEDVVFLCEGDPLFYGSFMYLLARLRDRFTVEIVPGVTSVSAGAARLALPVAARNEVLSVIPAPMESAALAEHIGRADAVAIMKVGRHLGRVRGVIDGLGLLDQASYIERATLAAEKRMPLAKAPDPAPYFSLILLTKGADPWL